MTRTTRASQSLRATRRNLLRGTLAAAVGLPWLETFTPRESKAQDAVPRRFIAMFSANGTVYDQWLPSGGETDFELSPILTPLSAHRDDLVIVEGLTQKGGGGDGHQNGMGGMLTGAELLPWTPSRKTISTSLPVGITTTGWYCSARSMTYRLTVSAASPAPWPKPPARMSVGDSASR